jgi:ABC-2 type transport system ATP-binding protein
MDIATTVGNLANSVLVLEQVRKDYGKVKALCGLNLRVNRGEILGFVGPNGAGKTTTLKVLAGLIKPDSGIVSLNAIDLQTDVKNAKRSLGYLPDTPLLYENLTLSDTLRMYARAWSLQLGNAEVLRTLSHYGLKGLEHRTVMTLSKGQKQRLSLACALLHEPSVLLLDEPFTGLDVESREFIRDKIEELADGRHKAIVLSSHDLADVERLCTRIALVVEGRVAYSGTEDEVRTGVLGRVFQVELALASMPLDLAGLANCTKEYSVAGSTVTFTLSERQSPEEVLDYFIRRGVPIRTFRPLGLEETLLTIMRGRGS